MNATFKTFAVFVATLLIAPPGALAQNSKTLTLNIPDFTQLVEVTVDMAYFYRLPSMNSGKLMEWGYNGDSFAATLDPAVRLYYGDTESHSVPSSDAFTNNFAGCCTEVFPVIEKKEGWYRVMVIGGANAKKAWVKSTDCRLLTVKETAGEEILFPGCWEYSHPAPMLSAATAKPRTTGKYQSLPFCVAYDAESGWVDVCFPIVATNTVLVPRVILYVNKASVSAMSLKEVVEEHESEFFTRLYLTIPRATKNIEAKVQQYLSTCTDAVFGKVVKLAFCDDGGLPVSYSVFYKNGADKLQQFDFWPHLQTELKGTSVTIPL